MGGGGGSGESQDNITFYIYDLMIDLIRVIVIHYLIQMNNMKEFCSIYYLPISGHISEVNRTHPS